MAFFSLGCLDQIRASEIPPWTTSTRLTTSTTFQFYFSGFTLSQHVTILSHELLSLPKTNMKKEGSGNVTGLKFESRTRTQSRTRSQI